MSTDSPFFNIYGFHHGVLNLSVAVAQVSCFITIYHHVLLVNVFLDQATHHCIIITESSDPVSLMIGVDVAIIVAFAPVTVSFHSVYFRLCVAISHFICTVPANVDGTSSSMSIHLHCITDAHDRDHALKCIPRSIVYVHSGQIYALCSHL